MHTLFSTPPLCDVPEWGSAHAKHTCEGMHAFSASMWDKSIRDDLKEDTLAPACTASVLKPSVKISD